jgi:hypothetical protein
MEGRWYRRPPIVRSFFVLIWPFNSVIWLSSPSRISSCERTWAPTRRISPPLAGLVDSVRVGEDVMGGFPIRVLVGSPKTRYPQRRRISERSAEIGGRCPVACCRGERIDYFGGIVAEKPVGQRDVIRPIASLVAGGEEVRQLCAGPLAQSDQVDRLTPRGAFLSTPSRSHLPDHARQQLAWTQTKWSPSRKSATGLNLPFRRRRCAGRIACHAVIGRSRCDYAEIPPHHCRSRAS